MESVAEVDSEEEIRRQEIERKAKIEEIKRRHALKQLESQQKPAELKPEAIQEPAEA